MFKKSIPYLILFVISYFAFDTLYNHFNQSGSAKASRLPCHNKTVVFERLYHDNLIEQLKTELKAGNFRIKTTTEPSVYMDPQLFNYVNAKEVASNLLTALTSQAIDPQSKNLLKLHIYENDKKHPGKKTKKAKLYTGYLVVTVLLENQMVYKIQVDFNAPKGEDIAKQIECIKASIYSL
jgi:hypothetical protein